MPIDPIHECQPYPQVFSIEKSEDSMIANRFSVVKRDHAKKCDGSKWLQKGSECSYINFGEDSAIIENNALTNDQVDFYSTPNGKVDLNKKGISLALEKRIALFFEQAILCYGMSGFTFSARGADDQIGSSSKLNLSSPDRRIVHKREAAHSSTIPTLIAHAKDGSTPDGFVYLKGTNSYYQHNATIGMNEAVNGADELIDGKGNDDKLRQKAVNILNRLADRVDELDPVKATKEFIDDLDAQVLLETENLKTKENGTEDTRRLVLERYHHKIEKIRPKIQENNFYDSLLGVIVPSDQNPLRDAVYKKRYDVIRLQEVVENRIAKKINDLKVQMNVREKNFVEYMLLKDFSEQSDRKILEKLLSKTASIFDVDYPINSTSFKSFRTRVENLKVKYKNQLDNLMRDLRADFRELSCAEFSYRASLFRDLRCKVKHWTQRDFCSNYEKTTGYKVSQAWVSRMEQLSRIPKAVYKTPINQRRRCVSLDDAIRCAQTFGVDPGLFLPSLFTSDY